MSVRDPRLVDNDTVWYAAKPNPSHMPFVLIGLLAFAAVISSILFMATSIFAPARTATLTEHQRRSAEKIEKFDVDAYIVDTYKNGVTPAMLCSYLKYGDTLFRSGRSRGRATTWDPIEFERQILYDALNNGPFRDKLIVSELERLRKAYGTAVSKQADLTAKTTVFYTDALARIYAKAKYAGLTDEEKKVKLTAELCKN